MSNTPIYFAELPIVIEVILAKWFLEALVESADEWIRSRAVDSPRLPVIKVSGAIPAMKSNR